MTEQSPSSPSAPPAPPKEKRPSYTGRIVGTLIASLLFLAIVYGGHGTLPGLGGPSSGIGGAFELVDGAGNTVTDQSFGNRLLLVQFGKPRPVVDGKPSAEGWLDLVGKALTALNPKERAHIAPLFIGLDVQNDTPQAVADYARAVHPDIIGLGGSAEQVDAAVKVYRIEVAYAQNADGSRGPMTGYLANTYLISPEGRFLAYFAPKSSPEDMVLALRKVLGSEAQAQGE